MLLIFGLKYCPKNMLKSILISTLILICFALRTTRAIDGKGWSYHLWLDPHQKYSLKWNVNTEEESITFLCEVQTRGWVGFGLSPNSGMKDSDVIIAWVDDKDGIAHFHVSLFISNGYNK